jgi:hypothetical protein
MSRYTVYRTELAWDGREPNAAGLPQDVFRATFHQVGEITALTAERALQAAKLQFTLPVIGSQISEARHEK